MHHLKYLQDLLNHSADPLKLRAHDQESSKSPVCTRDSSHTLCAQDSSYESFPCTRMQANSPPSPFLPLRYRDFPYTGPRLITSPDFSQTHLRDHQILENQFQIPNDGLYSQWEESGWRAGEVTSHPHPQAGYKGHDRSARGCKLKAINGNAVWKQKRDVESALHLDERLVLCIYTHCDCLMSSCSWYKILI
jgi:hypothetical protein